MLMFVSLLSVSRQLRLSKSESQIHARWVLHLIITCSVCFCLQDPAQIPTVFFVICLHQLKDLFFVFCGFFFLSHFHYTCILLQEAVSILGPHLEKAEFSLSSSWLSSVVSSYPLTAGKLQKWKYSFLYSFLVLGLLRSFVHLRGFCYILINMYSYSYRELFQSI